MCAANFTFPILPALKSLCVLGEFSFCCCTAPIFRAFVDVGQETSSQFGCNAQEEKTPRGAIWSSIIIFLYFIETIQSEVAIHALVCNVC
jgi:hypothetical protein